MLEAILIIAVLIAVMKIIQAIDDTLTNWRLRRAIKRERRAGLITDEECEKYIRQIDAIYFSIIHTPIR